MLSGSRDTQPSPERYRLYIDRVRINNSGSKPIDIAVTGVCESILSTDGEYMRSLECSASGGKEILVDFVGDGKKVRR